MPYILPLEFSENFIHVPFSVDGLIEMGRNPYGPQKADLARITLHASHSAGILRGVGTAANAGSLKIPAEISELADRYSRKLTFSLSVMKSRIVRDRAHGALDSSKLARIASPGIPQREFERLAGSAFKHREHTKAKTQRPRVAIVADMNHDIRTANTNYTKMLGTLVHVLGHAATLAGVEIAIYGSRGTLYGISEEGALRASTGTAGDARRLHIPVILKDWQEEISGPAFHYFSNNVYFVTTLRAGIAHWNGKDTGMCSRNGNGGIEYARANGADYVIGFGNFSNHEKADLAFRPNATMQKIVTTICGFMEQAA